MKQEDKKLCWDLEALYPDVESWEKDFAKLDALAQKFASFRGKLGNSASTLKAAIEAGDAYSRLSEKLYSYAHLRSDENTTIGVNRARVDRVCAKMAELSPLEAWFDPEMMAIPDETMKKFLASKELAFYKRSIEELLREKPHTLSEPEERLIGTLSDVLGTSDEVFSTLNDTDLVFGKVRDEKGKLRELMHGSYHTFLESPDRKVRKNAFHKLYKVYGQFRNSFAATLDGTVKRHVTMAKVRGYESPLRASLSGDNIPDTVYTGLIDTVHRHLDKLYDYFDLRAEALKVKRLDMYDLAAPLLPECSAEYTFEQASELVRAALKPLGKEYGTILKQAWDQRWIDVPERRGKRSGAYSGGCYDSLPYVLLNFNGRLDDVFTLAHELGHSMHSYFSNHTQEYHYADYAIFAAEVASTTNEMLLFNSLLNSSGDHALRAYLYAHLADEIRATLYRQTMFAEFELMIHNASNAGEPLTADYLDEHYYKLNALYHSPKMKPDRAIALEWARIPHFYYNFYVYKYATGISAAVKLSKQVLSGSDAGREAYLGFLRAGDSKDVLDILKDAGADLSTPEPVEAALCYFGEIVGKLKQELKALGRI